MILEQIYDCPEWKCFDFGPQNGSKILTAISVSVSALVCLALIILIGCKIAKCRTQNMDIENGQNRNDETSTYGVSKVDFNNYTNTN